MLKQTGMSLQYVSHVTSLLCDDDVATCFEIVNHGFASFIFDASVSLLMFASSSFKVVGDGL